jgi:hypothetical protein
MYNDDHYYGARLLACTLVLETSPTKLRKIHRKLRQDVIDATSRGHTATANASAKELAALEEICKNVDIKL